MKPILFIDRDGVILEEPSSDYQIDSIDKTRFVKGAITHLHKIATEFGYYKVMITNQDGLGTASFPTEHFEPSQKLMLDTLEKEGFVFDEIHIDKSFEKDKAPTRKPGTALLQHLMSNNSFDVQNSFVIGDRWSDIALAKNMGCKAIYLKSGNHSLSEIQEKELKDSIEIGRAHV